ncbi:MAG: glucosamine-6-phosphate deaminase [Thermoproteota archaeon]
MRVIIVKDYEEMSERAARIIAEQLRSKPDSVLGLATGSTLLGTYRRLIEMHRREGLDFSKVKTFNLDEYYGLPPDHPQSYHYFMFENLFKHVNINPNSIHILNGLVEDVEKSCREYEEEIRRVGGIDLQILGIGRNGHIAFNEPGSSLTGKTRLVVLSEETISYNARFFRSKEEVPRLAITMGCGTIMEAKKIVLLTSGRKKAKAVAAAIEGPVTSQVTASVLQMHSNVIAVIDEAAAYKLKNKEYYKRAEKLLSK